VTVSTVVAVVSGGLDSVTLAHHLVARGHGLEVVSFDYGQRHDKETQFAARCAETLGVPFHLVDLRSISGLLAGSSLTSPDVPVPDGDYREDTMRQTVVPNRNAIMINIAAALAVGQGYDAVAVGVHGGDHFIYPDCRPGFIDAQTTTLRLANEGFVAEGFTVLAPFVDLSKTEIVRLGESLGVPWEQTWSCYRGLDVHCGTCGTCSERREAFREAGVPDPTVYATAGT
jgi:7-cyano-7-deazaguanine synthase